MEKCCSKCKEIKPLEEFSKYKETTRLWCRVCCSVHNKNYYNNSDNREKERLRKRANYLKNKDKLLEISAQYKKTNADKIREYHKRYYKENKERISSRKDVVNKRVRERYANDASFKITKVLRSRLTEAIKNNHRSGSAIQDLGCTIEELKLYLESKFQPGMTWDNWGKYGWHIDHVVPLSAFDLTDPVQLKQACHYTNLQPLWAADNLSKSNKLL